MMAGKVTFVNKSNTGQSFKLNLFGSAKNCVKVSNLLAVFKASVVVMADGSLMEADDDGLSVDTFKPGSTHIITIVPAQGQEPTQHAVQPAVQEALDILPVQCWGISNGDICRDSTVNLTALREKHKPYKRARKAGPLIPIHNTARLEMEEPSSSDVGTVQVAHHSPVQQPAHTGEIVAFHEAPSGSALLKVASPTSNKESDDDAVDDADDDVAGSTLYIDNGKASRGHIKCVKCGHNKNPSAKLLCGHCGAYLREQTRARVAQRWEMLKEKANREGRLEDKAWQKRKKGAFDKLSEITMLDLENTYFALFIARRNRDGDKFSFDGWYSEGAGHEFVTTADVEAIWKSFVKKHHKRNACVVHGCGEGVEDHEAAS
ncbi:unnamed protein product [Sphagnum jensenii]|uniref:Uncharacterized protein n=1 Tax=Sphagnum jensenii TaxID=128206 RepID=A0ABP1BJK4_9BRYO